MPNSPQNGRDYGALQANNPYRNYQYTPSFWDRIGNGINQYASEKLGLGPIFKTNQMRVADEMANNAAVYDSQIAEVQREEMYNSSSEQAQRMRDAGINPDLQASGITGGEASPFDNQANNAMPSLEGSGDVQQVIGSLIQVPMTVASLVSGFQGISAQTQALKQGRIQYLDSLSNTMQSWVIDHVNEFDGIKTQSEFLKSNIFNNFMNDPEIKSMFPQYSHRKEAAYAAFRQAKSMATGIMINERTGQFLQSEANPMNHDNVIISAVMQASAELMRYRTEFDRDYFQNASGEQKAVAENQQNAWIETQNEAYDALIDYFMDWYKETNDIAYGMAVLTIEQLKAGNIENAALYQGISALAPKNPQEARQTIAEGVSEGVESVAPVISEVLDEERHYISNPGAIYNDISRVLRGDSKQVNSRFKKRRSSRSKDREFNYIRDTPRNRKRWNSNRARDYDDKFHKK